MDTLDLQAFLVQPARIGDQVATLRRSSSPSNQEAAIMGREVEETWRVRVITEVEPMLRELEKRCAAHELQQREFSANTARQLKEQVQKSTQNMYELLSEESKAMQQTRACYEACQRQLKNYAHLTALLLPFSKRLQSLYKQQAYVELVQKYIQPLQNQPNLADLEEMKRYYVQYKELQTHRQMQANGQEYAQLQRIVQLRIDFVGKKLKQHAIHELKVALERIQWPLQVYSEIEPEALAMLDQSFTQVIHVQRILRTNATGIQLVDEEKKLNHQEMAREEVLWAMEALLEPIAVRFRYHFSGDKRTNRLDKPEWFFNHILRTVQEHTDLLNKVIQPILEREGLGGCDALIRFLRGVVDLAKSKLELIMDDLMDDTELFCHTLDEVISFEQRLIHDYQYNTWYASTLSTWNHWPRCLDVFLKTWKRFEHWLQVDLKFAQQKLSDILNSKNVWLSTENAPLVDIDASTLIQPAIDSTHAIVMESAQAMALLLSNIAHRWQVLSEMHHRWLFVSYVQKPLLQEFYLSVARLAKASQLKLCLTNPKFDVAWKAFCGGVNCCVNVATFLSDMSESLEYLEIQESLVFSGTQEDRSMEWQGRFLPTRRLGQEDTNLRTSHTTLSGFPPLPPNPLKPEEEVEEVEGEEEEGSSASASSATAAAVLADAVWGPAAMIGPAAALTAAFASVRRGVQALQPVHATLSSSSHGGRSGDDGIHLTSITREQRAGDVDSEESSSMEEDHSSEGEYDHEKADANSGDATVESNKKSSGITSIQQCLQALWTDASARSPAKATSMEGQPIFEREIRLYHALGEAMLEDASETVCLIFKKQSKAYAKRFNWAQEIDITQWEFMEVSPDLGPAMLNLFDVLISAQTFLNSESFKTFWKSIAKCLDCFLFDDVVSKNHFSSYGSKQLAYDSMRLYQLFGSFCTHPERYFPLLVDSCVLLTMEPHRSMEILRALAGCEACEVHEVDQLRSLLEACGVVQLSPHQAWHVLQQRLYVASH